MKIGNVFLEGILMGSTMVLAAAETVPDWAEIFPEKIKTVALVAPACPAHSSEALDRAIAGLKQAGVRVKLMPHTREGEPARYETIAVEKRVADLEQAWLDPEVDLVWCIRGGIGTPDVVEKLNWEKLRSRPDLPVLGFSDITALLLAMLKEHAGHPYAAPSTLGLLTVDSLSLENFRRTMHGRPAEPLQLVPVRGGAASGRALAGHLRLLETMSRTRFRPDTAGKVIFIESPDFFPEQVCASLGRLRKEGFFDGCAAVVFGTLSRCGDEAETVIRKFAETVSCPVFMGFPYGHTSRNQVIDLRGRVTIDSRGLLCR